MRKFLPALLFIGLFIRFSTTTLAQDKIKISIIDFYGNRKVTTDELRKVLAVSEGEISTDSLKAEKFEARLKVIPGVKHAHTYMVCCEQKTGGYILFAGFQKIMTR
jgi:cell division septal protein FtsQ